MGDLFDRRDRRCIRAAAAEFETKPALLVVFAVCTALSAKVFRWE